MASWSAPQDNGGGAVSGYVITSQKEIPNANGGFVAKGKPVTKLAKADATTATLSGLTLAAYYSVSVAAKNPAGTGTSAATSTPVTPATAVSSNTVVLTTETMDALVADTSGILSWPAPAPAQVRSLIAGNVIVGGVTPAAPQGLLLTVDVVTSDKFGNYTVTTSQAGLDQAFTDLSIAESGNPLAALGSTFRAESTGIRSTRRTAALTYTNDVTLSLDNELDGVTLSGSLDLQPTVSVSIGLNQNMVGIPNGVNVSASATVRVTAQLTADVSTSSKWQIGEIIGDPIDIQVGPVPVILAPKIPVFLTASGAITLGVSAAMTIGASMSWSSAAPNTFNTTNLTRTPTLSGGPLPGVTATATGTVAIEAQPQVDIYDVTGPEVDATAQLKANVDFLGSAFFNLQPSVSVGAGWDIDLSFGPLSYSKSFDVTLATVDFPSFVIASPPNADLSVSPSSPTVAVGTRTTFTAARSDGASDPITWGLEGAITGDSITIGGILMVAAPGNRTLMVVARDSTGAVGEITVTVGSGFDPPGNFRVFLTDASDATVTWQAPADTGGSALVGYTLVTQPTTNTQKLSASATIATLSGLASGTNYVVSLFARNKAGKTSLAATGSTTLIGTVSLSGVRTVIGGSDGYCALLSTGGVDCWGYNARRRVGQRDHRGPDGEDGYDTPQAVTGITNAVSVTSDAVGSGYCALLSTGGVDCWGYNLDGELGNGTIGGPDGEDGYDTPQAVTGITNAVSVTSDAGDGYCAVLSTGGVDCWGYNDCGELGNGTTGGPDGRYGYDTPQAVTGITNAVSVTSDGVGDGNCALLSTGGVDCWG